MSQTIVTRTMPAGSPEVAAFLAQLDFELSREAVELPAFPDVSLQIQRLLTDDNVSTEKVVRLVGAEPVLAARVMHLANSAALNPSSAPVLELRTAVARLGFDSLRAAAVSFAMTQLRLAPSHQNIQQGLKQLWHDNVLMASTACVVARRCRRISADTALFAGLVSGVGKICLLARASRVPALFDDPAAYHRIVHDWHAEVARALLASWGVAEDIVHAVHTYEQRSHVSGHATPLCDVLSVAELLSFHQDMPEQIDAALRKAPAVSRLGLTAEICVAIITESQSELTTLCNTLEA